MSSRTLDIIVNQSGNAAAGINSLGGSLMGIGGKAALAAGAGIAALGAGTVALGAKFLSLGSDASEMQSKFDTVFPANGGTLTKSLDSFAKSVGRNKFELRGYAATLGDTLKPMGLSESAAADFSDNWSSWGPTCLRSTICRWTRQCGGSRAP